MVPFSCVVTPTSIVFASSTGKMVNISQAHINFDRIKETIKELQVALKNEDIDLAEELHVKASALANPAKTINRQGKGRVTVESGVVMFDGEPLRNVIAERILQSLREGFSIDSYVKFVENLMQNPSKRAVDELYSFIEKSTMGITDDGYIIAYKRVRNDYTDCHSGKFDNSVGAVLEMPRNAVDDDKERTCSYGFHFCSFSYLGYFGSAASGDRIVIVKVNPADVVSIPADYNDAKARCCKYVVIGEYEGDDKEDILGTRSVWNGADWREDVPGAEYDDPYGSDWEASDYDEWYYSSSSEEDLDDAEEDEVEAGPKSYTIGGVYHYEYSFPPRGDAHVVWVNTGDGNKHYTWEASTGRWISKQAAAPNVPELKTVARHGYNFYYADKAPSYPTAYDALVWVDTANNRTLTFSDIYNRWIPISLPLDPMDDASYRLDNGRYLTDVTYAYKPDGTFVSVKVRFSDGALVTFDKGTQLPDVEKLIGRSTGAPRIRVEIV